MEDTYSISWPRFRCVVLNINKRQLISFLTMSMINMWITRWF